MERLTGAGVSECALEARLLLGLATGASQAQILSGLRRELNATERERLLSLVRRRCAREPLAYLRGSQEFYGLEFCVDRNVLIPRPETELLVGFAIDLLKGGASTVFADVGTGSGCVAVSVAITVPQARAVATDVSRYAARVARANAERHRVSERVLVVVGDLLSAVRPRSLDLVLSNPPYIATSDVSGLQAEVRNWEPRIALDGGEDGLSIVRRLAREARHALKRDGRLALEVALGQGRSVAKELSESGYGHIGTLRDLAGIERVVHGMLA